MNALIAASAALVGVVIGGILQLEIGRVGQLREKQLEAASDFSGAAMAVFNALDRAMRALGTPTATSGEEAAAWLEDFKTSIDASREELRQTMLLLGRVEMLFGDGSPATKAAGSLVRRLHVIFAELDKHPGSVEVVTSEYDAAANDFAHFHKMAHDVFAQNLITTIVRERGG